MRHKNPDYEHPRAAYMPRTRGALSGLLLIGFVVSLVRRRKTEINITPTPA